MISLAIMLEESRNETATEVHERKYNQMFFVWFLHPVGFFRKGVVVKVSELSMSWSVD